jgi:hypothetical protein
MLLRSSDGVAVQILALCGLASFLRWFASRNSMFEYLHLIIQLYVVLTRKFPLCLS